MVKIFFVLIKFCEPFSCINSHLTSVLFLFSNLYTRKELKRLLKKKDQANFFDYLLLITKQSLLWTKLILVPVNLGILHVCVICHIRLFPKKLTLKLHRNQSIDWQCRTGFYLSQTDMPLTTDVFSCVFSTTLSPMLHVDTYCFCHC